MSTETKSTPLPWESSAPITPADARGGIGDHSFDDTQKTAETARLREEISAKDQQRVLLEADLQALREKLSTESDLHLRHQHRLEEMKLEAQLREQAREQEALRDELRREQERKEEARRKEEEHRAEEHRKNEERKRAEEKEREERDALIAQRQQIARIEQERVRLRNHQLAKAAPVTVAAFVGAILLGRWLEGDA